MNIVLPDGSKKELADGSTVADVAASIGAGLAKAALAGIVNDQPVDLSAPVAEGDSVAIVTAKSDEGLGFCATPPRTSWPPRSSTSTATCSSVWGRPSRTVSTTT